MRIVYTAASGESIDLSRGDIRAVSISGICPEKSIAVGEGAASGGSIISERRRVRKIKLRVVVCRDFEQDQNALSELFGASGSGRLEIFKEEKSAESIGISCCTESVSAEVCAGTNYADIVLICPDPFFEKSGGSQVYVQLCGSSGKWEFDDWELSEENETELSEILTGNSAFVPNEGGRTSGCVITVEVTSAVSEIRAVNAGTKEFIGVKGGFSSGDIVIFRCIEGEKGIFLSNKYDLSKMEDITHRIIWGSVFFGIAQNGTRVYISTDSGSGNVSAFITLKEYTEGF